MDALTKREAMTEAMLCAADTMTGHDMTDKLNIAAHHAEMQMCSYLKDHQLPLRLRVQLFQQMPGKPGERPKHLRPSQMVAGDWTDEGHGDMPLSISTIARLCRLEPDEEIKLYRWIDSKWPESRPDYAMVLDGLRAALARADAGKEWDEKREGMIDFILTKILDDPRESENFDWLDDGASDVLLAHVAEEHEPEAQLIELDPVDDPLATLEVSNLRSQLRVLHDEIAQQRAEIRGIDVDEWRAEEGHHSDGTGTYSAPAYADLSEQVACDVRTREPVSFAVAWHQQYRANYPERVRVHRPARKMRKRKSHVDLDFTDRTTREPADYVSDRIPPDWARFVTRRRQHHHDLRPDRKEAIARFGKQAVADLAKAKDRLAATPKPHKHDPYYELRKEQHDRAKAAVTRCETAVKRLRQSYRLA